MLLCIIRIFAFVLLGTGVFSACHAEPEKPSGTLKTGAEQTLLYFPKIRGKAVALVANHTSVIGRVHVADSLVHAGINLVKIFAPEHGFRGDADAGATIDNTKDSKTGLPVVSLYGSKNKPLAADLKDIDLVIYDIQDVGVRFYTYISTLHYVMEACAENRIPLMVLDRPDPLGYYVDGPVLDTAYSSFVGLHPIPVVYGMTAGELARMINGEGWLSQGVHCQLEIIPCSNYNHDSLYLLPMAPSPNLNTMEAVYLYPSMCFFEGTMMSLGRGTPFPFRVAGHPDYPLKSFSFKPEAGTSNKNPKFMGHTCYGISLLSLDIKQLQQMRSLNLQWLIEVSQQMGTGEAFFTDYMDKLAGNAELRKQILAGWNEERIRQSWQAELHDFMEIRKKYLLYEDF